MREARIPVEEMVSGTWNPIWRSYLRALRAERRSEATLETYGYALSRFQLWLRAARPSGLPALDRVRRDDVRGFLEHLQATKSPATAGNRYRSLRAFFRWLIAEGELDEDPMRHVSPPSEPEVEPPVLGEDAIRRMLDTCEGRDLRDRRDAALIRFLVDTGCRRSEVVRMTISPRDLDLDEQVARVVGKGDRERVLSFGSRCARDLDRYLRTRSHHPAARLEIPLALGREGERAPALWLGLRGPMTGSGVYQVVRCRARLAQLDERVFAHAFRSTFADMWLASDGGESDLMTLAGWESQTMLRRYTRRRRVERAREAHRRYGPGDRI